MPRHIPILLSDGTEFASVLAFADAIGRTQPTVYSWLRYQGYTPDQLWEEFKTGVPRGKPLGIPKTISEARQARIEKGLDGRADLAPVFDAQRRLEIEDELAERERQREGLREELRAALRLLCDVEREAELKIREAREAELKIREARSKAIEAERNIREFTGEIILSDGTSFPSQSAFARAIEHSRQNLHLKLKTGHTFESLWASYKKQRQWPPPGWKTHPQNVAYVYNVTTREVLTHEQLRERLKAEATTHQAAE